MLYVKDFDKKQFDVVYYEKYDHNLVMKYF